MSQTRGDNKVRSKMSHHEATHATDLMREITQQAQEFLLAGNLREEVIGNERMGQAQEETADITKTN